MSQAAPILAIAMVAAGYLSFLCATPPNLSPDQKDRHQNDRMSALSGNFVLVARRFTLAAVIYHALLVVTPHYAAGRMEQICPHPENINPQVMMWSVISTASLLLIFVGSYVRLSAFGGLGKSFTFHLAAPDHLVTTGVYNWVQHPSYTGAGMVLSGVVFLFFRWDAAPACWISPLAISQLQGWGLCTSLALLGASFWALGIRVLDEENMLKHAFGREWEDWHRSTKRFIPGLI